jgi:quercetin dioxygenase-like cupin family protein
MSANGGNQMLTRRDALRTIAAGSVSAASIFATGVALAATMKERPFPVGDSENSGVTVTVLMRQALPEIKSKQVTIVTVDYAPGAFSPPHRHPGSTFAYVLEGAIVSQVEPGPSKIYRAGQMWFEKPMALHRISHNASKHKPARLLAFLLADIGQKIVLPA